MTMTRVLALIATIPSRRASCERLLHELPAQSRPPDGVLLCLDGYGKDPAPTGPPTRFTVRRRELSGGPGHKWGAVRNQLQAQVLLRADILICIDDDAVLAAAPDFIRGLVEGVELGVGAAAAMGTTPDGHRAASGHENRGRLILGCGCGLALRAGHLDGLQELAEEVKAAGGPDALGPLGDDQALVSAHLWRCGVPLRHAATGPLSFAEGTQRDSQTRARQSRGEQTLLEQARAIAKITGWPFPEPVVELEEQPALFWEEELSAVPRGAVRARGAAPPAGYRRVFVMDGEEAERSGVYDVPPEQ